ncbi:hypothetical protein [Streptomyces mutomycini]|uniref:hypothetical protein n=1 Tax=Streptomyces mutomycini TaxID=284036 RepID=UPI0033EBAC17
MAEISYPFAEDDPITGASKAVSEIQWQSMAHMWGGDRVDYLLPSGSVSSTSLPFQPTVLSVTSVRIGAGRAWVGGFYYELTAPLTLAIEANSSNTGRLDLIVLRVDMTKPAVNLAVRKGVNAASPVVPQPIRQPGSTWELPVAQVTVPPNGGTVTVGTRVPMDMPPPVSYPWNAQESLALMPHGTFGYDMDSNVNSSESEYYNGHDGLVVSRTLGKTHTFTPTMINGASIPVRQCQWRRVAPGLVWFSMYLENASLQTDAKVTGTNWIYAASLPVPASGATGHTFSGMLENPAQLTDSGNMANYVALVGKIDRGGPTSKLNFFFQSSTSANGLDGLKMIPRRASITISGVYETDQFTPWQPVGGGA